MEPIRCTVHIRYWSPEKSAGLAVADLPEPAIAALGGLKQQRVRGRIGSADFTSSVMAAGSGRLALSLSKAILSAAGLAVGDTAELEITAAGRDA